MSKTETTGELVIQFREWEVDEPPQGQPLIVLGLYGRAEITTNFVYRIDLDDNPDLVPDFWIDDELQHDEHDPPDFWAPMPDLGDFYRRRELAEAERLAAEHLAASPLVDDLAALWCVHHEGLKR